MRWISSLLLACCLLPTAWGQSLPADAHISPDGSLQRSVVRIWWSRDLVGSGEYFKFAVNGTVIQNIMPRFQATYETDAAMERGSFARR